MNFSLLSDRRRVLLLLNLLSGGGKGISVSGTSPLILANAVKGRLKKLIQYGKVSESGGVITCNNGVLSASGDNIITTGTPEVVTVTGSNLLNPVPLGGAHWTASAGTDIADLTVDLSDYSNDTITIRSGMAWSGNTFFTGELEVGKTYKLTGTLTNEMPRCTLYTTDADHKVVRTVKYLQQSGPIEESVSIATGEAFIALSLAAANTSAVEFANPCISESGIYVPYSSQSIFDIPNLYAVDSLTDEHDIITGKTIRRTEATIYDSSNPPTGRFIGNATDGSVIVQALETLYEDDSVVTFTADGEKPLNLVKAEFSPVQDLHGQDAPWPAGGGKNKFNIDRTRGSISGSGPSDVRTFDFSKYYVGMSANNYLNASTINSFSVTENEIRYNAKNRPYGISFPLPVEEGTTYYFSGTGSEGVEVRVGYYDADGNYLSATGATNIAGQSITTPASAKVANIVFTCSATGENTDLTVSSVQLELGAVKTSFAPYENLCPISGYTGLDLTRAGENLWDGEWQQGTFNNDGSEFYTTTRIRTDFVSVRPSTTYTLSSHTDNAYINEGYAYNKNNGFIQKVVTTAGASATFTTPASCAYIRWSAKYTDNSAITPEDGVKVQLSLGSTVPQEYYSPTISTTTLSFGTTVYGGTAEVAEDGTATGSDEWGYLTLDGTETYANYSNVVVCKKNVPAGIGYNILSNYGDNQSIGWSTNQRNCFQFNKSFFGVNNETELKSLFADWASQGKPIQITYTLAEPVPFAITASDTPTAVASINTIWSNANGDVTVALADADVIEQNTPHPITLSEGTNTITVTANVEGIQFDVLYKGNQPEESAPLNSFSSSSFSSLNNPFNPGLSTMDTEPEDIPLDDQTGDLEDLQEEPETSDIDA